MTGFAVFLLRPLPSLWGVPIRPLHFIVSVFAQLSSAF